ncbi:MAG: hypothetical protein AAFN94_02815 [Pseudomonadota bacterium]
MRPVVAIDLICAARALLAVPVPARLSTAQTLFFEAEAADWHRRQTGDMHPHFGDGTLAAAARRVPMADERSLCDSEMSAAAIMILQMIVQRNCRNRSTC